MKAIAVSLVVVSLLGVGAYAQVTINLGVADDFAVLGSTGVTNVSNKTYIIGDVGSYPTCTVTGLTQSQVKGDLFLQCNTLTQEAQTDLAVAYGQAAGATCDTDLTGRNLGGMKLDPGVYCFKTAARLKGTLTLDALGNPGAQWVFQVGTTLNADKDSHVVMLLGHQQPPWKTGARGCNVYWQVGSTATIGASSVFVGKILAQNNIVINGGIFKGKSLTTSGAVKLLHKERINGPACNGTED